MSDNEDDAEFEASLADLEISGFDRSGDGLPGTADPEVASRLDSLHSTMSTLGMRLDSLVTSTTTYRSSLTDRLTEYADLVTKLTRTQSNDLEEYRRANERTISELRRSLSTSEEVLERVGARIDSMLTDSETSDDSSRRMLAEVRSILDAQESLGRFITESLDTFADRVTDRIESGQQSSVTHLDALRTTLDELAGRDVTRGVRDDLTELRSLVVDLRADVAGGGQFATVESKLDTLADGADADRAKLSTAVDELRETLLDVASGEVVGALWDEVRGISAALDQLSTTAGNTAETASAEAVDAVRAEVAAVREALADATASAAQGADTEPDAQLVALRDDVTSLTRAVRELLDQAEVVDENAPSTDMGLLTAVAADVSHLRDELAQGLVVEPSDALAGAVDELRGDLSELRDRLTALTDLETKIDALRTERETAADDWAHAPVADAGLPDEDETAERLDGLAAQLAGVRAGVDDIIARLDEGIELADDELTPPASAPSAATADQLAALRDQVTTEFDALREAVGRAATDAPESADASSSAASGGLDPDTIDLLREEIRNVAAQVSDSAAGGSDEVIETLAKELKALRRRIRLRAEGEVFSAADLDAIAAALADRLAD